ncbi:hypothetical protein GCU67_08135 [Modestobacter muralis]|uniref:Uncharacterized protein n=1 Tax=Modestobacter muralis TaxID=1608614 RepID=A0A6P0H517_9ACTN|nr:hypothetical protein [Modestobacter muralis]NEK94143.1 hypothetical protein [Modestobacter muralis]NEN50910.1 hypothetical protein [Modestobacter muralis]
MRNPQDETDAALDLMAAVSAVAAERAPARRLLALADLSDQAAALAGHVSAGRLPRRHVVTALSAAAAVAGIATGAAERVVVGALDQDGG